MRALLTLAFLLGSTSAWAQNPTCPTRPSSDNSNACASTAFVQNAVGGHVPLAHTHIFVGNASNISTDFGTLATFSDVGTLSLTPTTGLNSALTITQTGTGTAPVTAPFILGNFAYNGIMITDGVNGSATSSVVGGLIVQINTAGATASGFHGAGIFNANVNGVVPTDGSFGGVQGVSSLAQSLYPMGGTGTGVSTAKGAIYGFGVLAIAYGPGGTWPGATNIFNITGGEINVKIAPGASAYYKSGIQIASLSDDAVQGTAYDIGLSISAQSGSVGWKTGIGFNKANGGFPVSSGGALIETVDAFTVDRGIDLSSGVTYTTAAIKSPGFLVNGSGSVAVGTFLTPDSPITINKNNGASDAPIADNSLHLVGGNTLNNTIEFDAYAAQNLIFAREADGTRASKAFTSASRKILQILGQGYDGSAYGNAASISYTTGEFWTIFAHGTYIAINTTPLGSTTIAEALRIQPSGGLSVGALAIASDPGIGKINANGVVIQGSSSGAISIIGQAAAGTYNFNLPITVGSAGQVLTSQAGGATAMTWTTLTTGTVTSIATTGPITGGTITSTGTIACATCVTSAASLTSNSLMIGAGSQASAVTATGTGVLTALGTNVGSAGAFVTFNGAGGTPSSLTLTNATGLPTTGLSGTLQAAQEPAHTGDVTNSAGSLALTLVTTQTAVHTWSLVNTYLENNRYSMTAGTGAGFWLASKVATVATADRFFFGSDASANDTFRIFSTLSGGNALQFASSATSTLGTWTLQGTLLISGLTNVATTSAVCYNTGTGALTYNSTVGTCTVSDESLKNIEGRIEGALDKLLRINGIRFTWRDNAFGSGEQIGIGAQTVEAVFPELVQTDSLGHKSADYQRLTAPIIEALRELKGDNDNLREEIKQLSRSR